MCYATKQERIKIGQIHKKQNNMFMRLLTKSTRNHQKPIKKHKNRIKDLNAAKIKPATQNCVIRI